MGWKGLGEMVWRRVVECVGLFGGFYSGSRGIDFDHSLHPIQYLPDLYQPVGHSLPLSLGKAPHSELPNRGHQRN